jgi:nitrite reductase/ring-hydroxylating ferredoxin subunit
MAELIESEPRALCRVEDIPDGGAKGFPPAPGGFTGLMAVRQGDAVYVYVNSCPHVGTPLDWTPDRFLSADGQWIICATHGAEFRITDGMCTRGPCRGDALEVVPYEIRDGVICVAADAGL